MGDCRAIAGLKIVPRGIRRSTRALFQCKATALRSGDKVDSANRVKLILAHPLLRSQIFGQDGNRAGSLCAIPSIQIDPVPSANLEILPKSIHSVLSLRETE